MYSLGIEKLKEEVLNHEFHSNGKFIPFTPKSMEFRDYLKLTEEERLSLYNLIKNKLLK